MLTLLFQVGADYTIDEWLCLLVCDGYHFHSVVPLWALSFLLSSAFVSTLALWQVQQYPKAAISEAWTLVWNCIRVIWTLWSQLQSACWMMKLGLWHSLHFHMLSIRTAHILESRDAQCYGYDNSISRYQNFLPICMAVVILLFALEKNFFLVLFQALCEDCLREPPHKPVV